MRRSDRAQNWFFPVADGKVKVLGGDKDLRTSILIGDNPERGEGQRDFLGESERSLPPPQDSLPDVGEARNDFWSISGNYFYHHHVEPRVKLNVPREETHPTPLKYIDATRDTNTTLDVDHDTSDAWTGFKLPSWTKGFHTGITGLSGGLKKKTSNIQVRSLVARMWTIMSDAAQRRETETRQCQKTTRHSLHWPERHRVEGHLKKARKLEIPL